jgi:N-methylhydantoinase A
MATELFKTLAQRGLDPSDFALMPFGGAGPTHANLLAHEAGIERVVIPPAAGTFCALGAVTADLRRDFVRSLRIELEEGSVERLSHTLATLVEEGEAWLNAEGDLAGSVEISRAVDMRYAGQAYELRVNLDHLPEKPSHEAVAEAFHQEHERVYGFRDPAAPVQVTTVRLAVIGRTPAVRLPRLPASSEPPVARSHRPIFLTGAWHDAAIYDRHVLRAGQSVNGPAVIEQEDTTVVVLPNWTAKIDASGNLHLTPSQQP